MKNVLKISAIGFAMVFASCKKDLEKRMEGDWDYESKTTITQTSPQNTSFTEEDSGVASFNDDGTGVFKSSDGENNEFRWSSSGKSKVQLISLDTENQPMDTLVFNVEENKRKSQSWSYSGSYSETNGEMQTEIELDLLLELSKR